MNSPPDTIARKLWRLAPWLVAGVLLIVIVRQVYPSVDLGVAAVPAPDFELLDLDGELFRLSDHRGKVLVLNFWATWCPPCRAEIPSFIRLQNEFREEGVLFVGISLDEEGAEAVAPFADARAINYPLLMHGHRAAAAYGGVGAIPTTILVDRAGRVRFRHEGFLLPQALRPAIRALIGDPLPA
jgi:peroxiredoxin